MSERVNRMYPLPGFGATLRAAREAKGLRQEDVANAIGSRKGLVSLWEREKNWPSDGKLIAVCEVLGLEPPLPDRNAKGRRSQRRGNCAYCGKTFPIFHDEKFCSRKCAYVAMSERQGYNWKGGKQATTQGYIKLHMPDHPSADKSGYVLEHRIVMEEVLGRLLAKHEHVHHKNADRSDNRPENLELWTSAPSANHIGARVSDIVLDQLRDEIRKIVREELAAAGITERT